MAQQAYTKRSRLHKQVFYVAKACAQRSLLYILILLYMAKVINIIYVIMLVYNMICLYYANDYIMFNCY